MYQQCNRVGLIYVFGDVSSYRKLDLLVILSQLLVNSKLFYVKKILDRKLY